MKPSPTKLDAGVRGMVWGDWLALAMRFGLGGWFVYSGWVKALEPVDFLKNLHEYGLPLPLGVLNVTAAWLPWFEIWCGVLMIGGVAVRAVTTLCLGMLIPFTILVLDRALEVQAMTELAFCAIRFDCGCGTGEIGICQKLGENGLFMLLALGLLGRKRVVRSGWTGRPAAVDGSHPPAARVGSQSDRCQPRGLLLARSVSEARPR